MSRRLAGVVVAVAVLVTGCFEGSPEFRVNHAVAAGRAAEPAPVDPASGELAAVWRTYIRMAGSLRQQSHFVFAAGQVLAISPAEVVAHATGDGAKRWHYGEGDVFASGQGDSHSLAGYALSEETLVLVTERDRTIGLDAVTGKVLWRSTRFRPANGSALPEKSFPGPAQPGGHGVVALTPQGDQSGDLVGVDVRTGARRWRWPGPKPPPGEYRCDNVPHDSDGGLMLVQTICGEEVRLFALDPETGKPAWERVYKPMRGDHEPPTAGWAISRAGLTLVPESTGDFRGVLLIDRDGDVLHRFASPHPVSGSLAVTGGRAVVGYRYGDDPADLDSARRLASVDVRTGKAGEPVRTDLTGPLATRAGRVYGQRARLGGSGGRPAGLLPGALEVVDPRTLRGTVVMIPSPAASGFWGGRTANEQEVLFDGGHVYTVVQVNGRVRLTAYDPGDPVSPPELGGVPAGDWPDACELGKGLGDVTRREPGPALKVGSHVVPGWSCVHHLESSGLEPPAGYEVKVAWVARDDAEADRLLDPEATSARPVSPGIGERTYTPEGWPNRIVLRWGRYVTVVDGFGGADPKGMAERVVADLKSLG